MLAMRFLIVGSTEVVTMRYVHSNLLKNEKVIYEAEPHRIVFALPFFLGVFAVVLYFYLKIGLAVFSQIVFFGMPLYEIFSLVIFVLALFFGIKYYIFHKTSEYAVTNKRIIMKTGWIQRRSIEIFLEKVEAIYIDQTLLGRLFGYGTVIVVGTGGSKDPFLYVPSPLQFRKKAQQQIDEITQIQR